MTLQYFNVTIECQNMIGYDIMAVCHQRNLKEFNKEWVAGAEWLVQRGGGDLTNLDYIVQRCALLYWSNM